MCSADGNRAATSGDISRTVCGNIHIKHQCVRQHCILVHGSRCPFFQHCLFLFNIAFFLAFHYQHHLHNDHHDYHHENHLGKHIFRQGDGGRMYARLVLGSLLASCWSQTISTHLILNLSQSIETYFLYDKISTSSPSIKFPTSSTSLDLCAFESSTSNKFLPPAVSCGDNSSGGDTTRECY